MHKYATTRAAVWGHSPPPTKFSESIDYEIASEITSQRPDDRVS